MPKKRKRAPGGGRKKLPYKTVMIRVPVPVKPDVHVLIQRFKSKINY